MGKRKYVNLVLVGLLFASFLLTTGSVSAQIEPYVILDDDGSFYWDHTVEVTLESDLENFKVGNDSMIVNIEANAQYHGCSVWLLANHSGVDLSMYDHFSFWFYGNGSTYGYRWALNTDGANLRYYLFNDTVDGWSWIITDLASWSTYGSPNLANVSEVGFMVQDNNPAFVLNLDYVVLSQGHTDPLPEPEEVPPDETGQEDWDYIVQDVLYGELSWIFLIVFLAIGFLVAYVSRVFGIVMIVACVFMLVMYLNHYAGEEVALSWVWQVVLLGVGVVIFLARAFRLGWFDN